MYKTRIFNTKTVIFAAVLLIKQITNESIK